MVVVPVRRAAAALLIAGTTALPGAASAQLFSPGKLARAHASLEGLSRCTECHQTGKELSPERCLDCHDELAGSVRAHRGYHGRIPDAKRNCERCHHEHQGLEAALIDWTPKRFDHRQAGYPLDGKHAKVECEACHDPRLISDPVVAARLAKPTKTETYLGLSTRCAACHFDEHRGQEGDDCKRCHDTAGWKPANGFDHAKTKFALRGAHAAVECAKCHRTEDDTSTLTTTFPAPVARTFARYAPVAHEACTDCHQDPHRGRLGVDCTSCHDEEDWKKVDREAISAPTFHDRTRYPLTGEHRKVACKACHLPLGSSKEVYRGLAFDRCDACHLDAHGGQVGTECEKCHDVRGFTPPLFDARAHQDTRYRLEGAHLAVACLRCHARREVAPAPPALVRGLEQRGRKPLASGAALALPGPTTCASCHEDPHRGQLSDRPCEACHQVDAFEDLRFDHGRDSKFALTGRHASTACAGCHRRGEDGAVRYRPLETACAGCHQDVHAGQLGADCQRCHGTERFATTTFDATAHAKARFPLEGRHAPVACARCHQMIEVGGHKLRRYRPLPLDCVGCHADFHQGAFDRFDRACDRCHTVAGWTPAAFDHAWTGFALRGAHQNARCRACHQASLAQPVQRECSGCHRDVHAGDLGLRCAGCHDEKSWKSRFDAEAHRRTAFPLSGAHRMIPCEECHLDSPARGFVRTAVGCIRCHEQDYRSAGATSIDHVVAGFDTTCQRCHTPWRFSRAAFPGHYVCFAISSGPHLGIGCKTCHQSVMGLVANQTCNTNNAACTSCHEHTCDRSDRQHGGVSGYQCKDRKCYECHRFTAQ